MQARFFGMILTIVMVLFVPAPACAQGGEGGEWMPISPPPVVTRTGFSGTVFIAQQSTPSEQELGMYGNISGQAFLIGGGQYGAGIGGSLTDFLSLDQDELNTRISEFVARKYDIQDRVRDLETELWSVPDETGLVVMDIEAAGHPDKLYAKYSDPWTWNYWEKGQILVGDQLVTRIFEQYEKCITATKKAFPNAKIGLYGIATPGRQGCVSPSFAKNIYLFKAKAFETGCLDKLDFLCPRLYPFSTSTDQLAGCKPRQGAGERHAHMVKISLNALRYGPQILEFSEITAADPYGLMGDVDDATDVVLIQDDPDEWEVSGWDPVADSSGSPFLVCPLLSFRLYNNGGENDREFCIDVDPNMDMTLRVMVDLLEPIINAPDTVMVNCYAYWGPDENGNKAAQAKRWATFQCLYCGQHQRLGDYDVDGDTDDDDYNIFGMAFSNNEMRADVNGDGVLDADDIIFMDLLRNDICPACTP